MDNQSLVWAWAPYESSSFKSSRWRKLYIQYMQQITMFVNLFGVFCNIPVLIIFYKDGLSSNANICFFSLALTDLYISVFYCVWNAWDIAKQMDFLRYPPAFENLLFYASRSVDAMNSLSAWITAIITLERLLCILFH